MNGGKRAMVRGIVKGVRLSNAKAMASPVA